MKKALSLAIAVLMIVAAFAVFTVSSSADIAWEVKDGVLYITGEGAMEDYAVGDGQDNRPWAEQIDDIEKVVVGDGITVIGKCAFTTMPILAEVEFGKDVKDVHMDAIAYNSALETVVFKGPVEKIGQGIVYSSNNILSVTITQQTVEQFKDIASVAPYNLEVNGGIASGFDTAEFTVIGDPIIDPNAPKEIGVTPQYGKIENWNGDTYFIVGGVTEKMATKDEIAGVKDEEGNYTTAPVKYLKVVIKDETDGKSYTIPKYAFDTPKREIYGSMTFLRIAACQYGIVPVPDHAYTITLEVYKVEDNALVASGTSEAGAFVSTQDDFLANGAIVLENPPHTYEEGGEVVPTPTPTPTPTTETPAPSTETPEPIGDKVAIVLGLYGETGTEKWGGSPNKDADGVDGETQILICPAFADDPDTQVAAIVSQGLDCKVTITGPDGKSKTYDWKVETVYADWLMRFEPCNGNRTAEDKFVPEAGVEYKVTLEAVGTDGKTYYSPEPATITFEEASIVDGNPDIVPTGDSTAILAVLAIVALFGAAIVIGKKVYNK